MPPIQRYPTKAQRSMRTLKHWTHEASNEKYWNQLIKRLTHHPETTLPEQPEEWGPIPSWQARNTNSTQEDDSNNSDDKEDEYTSQKPTTPTTSFFSHQTNIRPKTMAQRSLPM